MTKPVSNETLFTDTDGVLNLVHNCGSPVSGLDWVVST